MAVVTVSSVAEVVDILMAALGPAVDLSPKHPWFSNTCGTVYITTSLTYSLFLKDIHMQNIDWVELGYKFMRTNGDIPPTVFMFENWTEFNFNIISDWTLFQYQYHLKRKFQHDLTTACYFFHTYLHIPQNEGSNQNKKVRAHNTIPGTHVSFTPILSHSHPFCALQILKVYSLCFIDV